MNGTHWTDTAIAQPIFSSVIEARGPGANIFEILGKARVLMRQLKIPSDRIEALSQAVRESSDYDSAVALIERWFVVRR